MNYQISKFNSLNKFSLLTNFNYKFIFYQFSCKIYIIRMKKFNLILIIFFFFLLSNCKIVQNKADEINEKDHKYLQKFLNKKKSLLISEFGNPDIVLPNDGDPDGSQGSFIYISKKYGIKCQRTFEIDESDFIVAFSSKGCF